MVQKIEIFSKRFQLRTLTEQDVSERYLRWLDDADSKKFITAAVRTKSLSDLREYVRDRINRDDVVFLGIFEKTTGLHIGNIKYDPVNSELGYAIMGILIGDSNYRGKRVTSEVLTSSVQWLKEHRNIRQIILGVDCENIAAIRAYEKVGFVLCKSEFLPNHPSTMVWHLVNQVT